MGEHVSIEHGHLVRIDIAGWIAQRTGTEHTDLTAALRDWGRADQLTAHPRMDWTSRAELWCAAREYLIPEGFPAHHDHAWLSAGVDVLPTQTGDYGAVVIVSVDGDAPTVYADVTTDDGYWYQVDTLDIVCPCGRRWSWQDNQLTTPHGQSSTVAAVFGEHPHAPFTPCPGCQAYDAGETHTPCPCPGTDIIVCPHCGRRCDLHLPPVPTLPQRRPFAVLVSEAIEYQGWVLATDADDADDEARRLLDDGGSATGRGHLDIVHLDRDVMTNDAAEVCWQCRADPRRPNPACPHPTPHPAGPVQSPPALVADPEAITAWLAAVNDARPHHSNAEALGIGTAFGYGHDGFLSTLDDLLAAGPTGLVPRSDVDQVELWLIPDGDILDRGAVITVDLTNGVRLATPYQDGKNFADRDARGLTAAVSALRHIASQASQVVATYQSRNPQYQPPRQ